ncbi:hypothetical protein ACNKHU_26755 [Shigella flexneri]
MGITLVVGAGWLNFWLAFITSLQVNAAGHAYCANHPLGSALLACSHFRIGHLVRRIPRELTHLNFTQIKTVDELNQALVKAKGKP